MKILFSGSFKFFDEMKKLKKGLESAGFKCILPKFYLGDHYSTEEIKELKEKQQTRRLK
jgi:hypothetical protein